MAAADEIIIPGTEVIKTESPPNLMRKLVLEDSGAKPVAPSHTSETYALIEQGKTELQEWHPQWGKKPAKDTRAEDIAAWVREENDRKTKKYRPENPLTNEKERIRNLMHVRDFCAKLHNILGLATDGGSRIFINVPPAVTGFDNTKMAGLFIKMRGLDMFTYHTDLPPGWKKICAIQVPYMSEWGIMNLDERGMFKSWKYIGWRGQVLLRLILAEAITEEEAHREFGVPQGEEVDREYRKILDNWRRNAKRAE